MTDEKSEAPSQQDQETRCPECGYTEDDARQNMDHRLCPGYGRAPWSRAIGESPKLPEEVE